MSSNLPTLFSCFLAVQTIQPSRQDSPAVPCNSLPSRLNPRSAGGLQRPDGVQPRLEEGEVFWGLQQAAGRGQSLQRVGPCGQGEQGDHILSQNVCSCMCACACVCARASGRARARARARACVHACMRSCVHAFLRACVRARACMPACVHACVRACVRMGPRHVRCVCVWVRFLLWIVVGIYGVRTS